MFKRKKNVFPGSNGRAGKRKSPATGRPSCSNSSTTSKMKPSVSGYNDLLDEMLAFSSFLMSMTS